MLSTSMIELFKKKIQNLSQPSEKQEEKTGNQGKGKEEAQPDKQAIDCVGNASGENENDHVSPLQEEEDSYSQEQGDWQSDKKSPFSDKASSKKESEHQNQQRQQVEESSPYEMGEGGYLDLRSENSSNSSLKIQNGFQGPAKTHGHKNKKSDDDKQIAQSNEYAEEEQYEGLYQKSKSQKIEKSLSVKEREQKVIKMVKNHIEEQNKNNQHLQYPTGKTKQPAPEQYESQDPLIEESEVPASITHHPDTDLAPNSGIIQNYNDDFKRKYIEKLQKVMQTMIAESDKGDFIKAAAHKIGIQVYELKTWIIGYEMIFNIQKQSKGKPLTQKQVLLKVKKHLAEYMCIHQREKKYKIMKILTIVFKNFQITETRLGIWLNNFVAQHYDDLKGIDYTQYGVNLNSLRRLKKHRNHSSEESIADDDEQPEINHFPTPYDNMSFEGKKDGLRDKDKSVKEFFGGNDPLVKQKIPQLINDQKPKRGRRRKNLNINSNTHEQVSAFPSTFKKKVAMTLDQSINEIFMKKAEEFCISVPALKAIHQEYFTTSTITLFPNTSAQKSPHSSLSFINQNDVIKPRSKSPIIPPVDKKMPIDCVDPASLLARLDLSLINFINSRSVCPVSLLEKQTDTMMQKMRFPVKLKNEVRSKWFAYFLRKNKLSVSRERNVISLTNPPPKTPTIPTRHPSSPPLKKKPVISPNPTLKQDLTIKMNKYVAKRTEEPSRHRGADFIN